LDPTGRVTRHDELQDALQEYHLAWAGAESPYQNSFTAREGRWAVHSAGWNATASAPLSRRHVVGTNVLCNCIGFAGATLKDGVATAGFVRHQHMSGSDAPAPSLVFAERRASEILEEIRILPARQPNVLVISPSE